MLLGKTQRMNKHQTGTLHSAGTAYRKWDPQSFGCDQSEQLKSGEFEASTEPRLNRLNPRLFKKDFEQRFELFTILEGNKFIARELTVGV